MGPKSTLLSRFTFLMRILGIAAICAALAVPAAAQRIRGGVPASGFGFGGPSGLGGVPASVTSFGFGGHPGFGGVPASVTSPGFGFVPRTFIGNRIFFGHNPRFFVRPGFRRGFSNRFGFGNNAFFGGAITPWFPAPIVAPFFDYSEGEAVQPENAQPGQPQPIVIVVPDRDRELSPPEQAPSESREQAPPAASKPEPPPPPTVVVLRNGQKLELTDYAITGDTLYDLHGGRTKKISLAEVDLPATVKANEDRGMEFTLPNSARVHIQ